MAFPAIQTAGLVTSGTVVTQNANFTAVNGGVHIVTTGAGTITATLPPIAQGGPVTIRKVDSGGAGTVLVKTNEGATTNIDTIAGNTGRTVGAASTVSGATLVSDGVTNWYTVNS